MPLLAKKNHLASNLFDFGLFMERSSGIGFKLKRTMDVQI